MTEQKIKIETPIYTEAERQMIEDARKIMAREQKNNEKRRLKNANNPDLYCSVCKKHYCSKQSYKNHRVNTRHCNALARQITEKEGKKYEEIILYSKEWYELQQKVSNAVSKEKIFRDLASQPPYNPRKA